MLDETESDRQSGVGGRTNEITQAASTLFLSKGYSGTTMNDIAGAVGILPGSLYHHFESKEAAAVAILDEFNEVLHNLPARLRKSGHLSRGPEDRIRELCSVVTSLSLRYAGAVRLRAFEPPSSASDRFRAAIHYQPVGLYRLWRSAAIDLSAMSPRSYFDPGMLTHALQIASTGAGTDQPSTIDPQESSQVFCDSLVHGIINGCPDDDDLDNSAPMLAVRESVAEWTKSVATGDPREVIITAAREEFARRGFGNTTIRDISEASGVPMGTIYRRVDSMEAMYTEIAQNYSDQVDRALRAALTTEPSSVAATLDAIGYVTTHAHKKFHEETRMMILTWRERKGQLTSFEQRYRQLALERMSMLTDVLAEGQDDGTVRAVCSPDILAPHLRSILWISFQEHDRASMKRIRRFIRGHVLRGAIPVRE